MDPMIYLDLFVIFLQVGLFSIGGGYAAIPIIEDLVVDQYGWLTMAEFTEMLTISEMTPGPITLNVATFVGEQEAGIPGALIATFSSILPSIIIVSGLAFLYFKFSKITVIQGALKQLRPVIIGLIASSCLSLIISSFWGTKSEVSISLLAICCMTVLIASAVIISTKELRATRNTAIMTISGVSVAVCASVAMITYSFVMGYSYINMKVIDLWSIGIFVLCLALLRMKTFKVNPILILLFAGSIGLCIAYVPYLFT